MDDETQRYIDREVHKQLTLAVDGMRRTLRAKREAERRKTWWRRALSWVSQHINGVVLEFRRKQWARLSEAERAELEDKWLTRTLPKLRGNGPVLIRRLESGDEDRARVLESDFVKNILEQPAKDVN
jgi:hypothetical protein